jgi:cytochrome P450 family 110
MDRCQRELGDIYMLRLVGPGMVFVSTSALAKQVYTASEDDLVAGEAKIKVFGKILGRSSTLLLDGAKHLERRRLLLPRFRGELAQQLAPAMAEACASTLAELPTDRTFALHGYMHRIAFQVISRSLFAVTAPARIAKLEAALRDFAHDAVTSRLLMFPAFQRDFGSFSPWGRVVRVVARARREVLAEIHMRRTMAVQAEDILGVLLETELTDSEIVDEILTMVAAGHETTSMALTWLCYAVYTRPAVLAKLRAERGELADRPYLEATVRESLRMYSVIPNGSGRIAKRTFQLGGFDVPAGAMVTVAFHAVHRTLDVFADADTFRPERFLDAKYSPYESLPFGGGTRRCLGMPFAMLELGLVLASFTERFDLEIVQRDVRPMWRGRFLTPNKGLLVRATPATQA